MSFLRNKLYLAVVLGHFMIDVFSNMGPVVITFLSVPMALTAAQIGLAVGAYQLIGAVTQPLFGWLTDKIGSRWLGPGSVAWTIGLLTLSFFLAQITNSFMIFLIPFCLAALGSGAFHPQGTVHSSAASKKHTATAMAIFFLFGQAGLGMGPIIVGWLLERTDLFGIYIMALGTIPVIFFMVYGMSGVKAPPPEVTPSIEETPPTLITEKVQWGMMGLLAVIVGVRSWVFLGTVTFLPKVFQDMGWDAAAYGSITGVFWIGSAIAGVVMGNLADRWGRRLTTFITMIIGSIVLYFLPMNSGWGAFPLAIISGSLLGASHSILVVISQELLPVRKALASGVTLGYMFGTGAIAAWAIGMMDSIWGLGPIIQVSAGLGILVGILTMMLPATRKISQPRTKRAIA